VTNVLEVKELHASYGATPVLHGIDLEIREGGITALLGANGAGKTTLLRAICQMMVTTRGMVTLRGKRVDGKATEQIVRLGVAHVPDGRGTFLQLTVDENLRLGGYTRRDRAGAAADQEKIYEYFPRLRQRHRQQAGVLSGGEQQMLAIGRALMSRPRLLLLDEPSFGLAPLVVPEIFEIVRRINTRDGMSVLLVEQNAALAFDVAETAYLLETGRIVRSGPSSRLRDDAAVRHAYLGE
jgi:branched-chain amino acid transport system ATP-binding protein